MPGNRRTERRRGNGLRQPVENSERLVSRADRTAVFGKTKLCKFFILGACARGTDCAFAHDASEMQSIPDLSRTKICKTLINTGSCNDPDCTYAHNKEELRVVEGVPPATSQQALPSSSGSASSGKGRRGGHNEAQAGGHNASAQGQQTYPMAAGLPPTFAGQALDTAQQMALQQWMALQMSQMQMMAVAAQSQAQQRVASDGYRQGPAAQVQGAAAGESSSFLYNALFDGDRAANAALAAGSPQLPSSSFSQPAAARANASGSRPEPKKVLASKVERDPAESRFEPAQVSPVPYKVKNTFIDVHEQNSPLGLRSIQSAAGCLYGLGGNSHSGSFSSDDGSPLQSTLNPSLAAPMVIGTTSPSLALTDESVGLNLPKPMARINTWASDLGCLTEEDKEDNSEPSREPSRQVSPQAPLDDEGRGEESNNRSGSTMEGFVVKNTFLEYKAPAVGGMRQVQTASGSLHLMSQE